MESKTQKTTSKYLENLKNNWEIFLSLVLNPFAVVLLITSVILFFSISSQSNPNIVTILTFILSCVTGLLGGIYAKKWDDLTQEKIITIRGKSANRSLQLLLNSAIALEKRVATYLQRQSNVDHREPQQKEVIIVYLEEIIFKCVGLEQEILNSIQNWTDIVPEADVSNVLEYIRGLKNQHAAIQTKLERINIEQSSKLEKTEEEKTRLEKEKQELINDIIELRQKLFQISNNYGVPAISGSLISGGTILANLENYTSLESSYTVSFTNPNDVFDPDKHGMNLPGSPTTSGE